MSTWKLVEAEAITPANPEANNTTKTRDNTQFNSNSSNNTPNAERNDRNNNGRRQSRERRRSGQGRKNREQETIESRQYYAHLAVQTLEYYFAPDSLISDTTIRSYLDEAGYIPIAFVCNFPEIVAIGALYEDILVALQKSTIFEVDVDNETIRLHDWQKWLMPNGLGGFGLPRYIKQPTNYSPNEYYNNTNEEWIAGAENAESNDSNTQEIEVPTREQELSPTATEYTPPKAMSSPTASTTKTAEAETTEAPANVGN